MCVVTREGGSKAAGDIWAAHQLALKETILHYSSGSHVESQGP